MCSSNDLFNSKQLSELLNNACAVYLPRKCSNRNDASSLTGTRKTARRALDHDDLLYSYKARDPRALFVLYINRAVIGAHN